MYNVRSKNKINKGHKINQMIESRVLKIIEIKMSINESIISQ